MPIVNLGKKEEYDMPVRAGKKKIYYPHLHIDKSLPIDSKDIGKEIIVSVKLKVNSVEKRVSKNGEKYSYSFDVTEMIFPYDKKKTPNSVREMKEKLYENS